MNVQFPKEARRIRVVLVDDHPLIREGTEACLRRTPDIEVVGVTGEGCTALRLVTERRPDILLLDIHLPDLNGIEVARHVKKDFPRIAILVLTGYDEIIYFRSLLRLGVNGYLRKSVSTERVVEAIREIAHGKKIINPATSQATTKDLFEPLSDREQDVLMLLGLGMRNNEIAERLLVSVKTVEFHVGNILSKLDARSRTEALFKARRLGLIAPDEYSEMLLEKSDSSIP